MTTAQFVRARDYMTRSMRDSAHDVLHVYRVLNYALIIARGMVLDRDVLILAALLHDVGRAQESKDRHHADLGAEMAREFLHEEGYPAETAAHVADCILTHSNSAGRKPASPEAEVLFDADKLDLAGSMGVVRSVLWGGKIGEPLYLLDDNGIPTEGLNDEAPSLMREYNAWLCSLSQQLHTQGGTRLARQLQGSMNRFFHGLIDEINFNHAIGTRLLQQSIEPDVE